MKKSEKKVVLGFIGDFEVYTYPFDYPDKVFIGTFPISTSVDKANIGQLLSNYNKIRAYLHGDYFKKDNSNKGANSRRHTIQRAYKCGLNAVRGKKQA